MLILKRNFRNRGIEITVPAGGLGESDNEHVTTDLHVGDRFNTPGDSMPYSFGNYQVIKPGRCIVVFTREKIAVPDGVFGFICARGSLTFQGLMVASTKIDPLFYGHLGVAVFNAGTKPVKLNAGDAFCSVAFQTLEQLTFGRARSCPVISADPHGPLWYWWASRPHAISWSVITALITAVVTTLLTLWLKK